VLRGVSGQRRAVPPIIFYMDAPVRGRAAQHGATHRQERLYLHLARHVLPVGTVRFDLPRRDDGMSA